MGYEHRLRALGSYTLGRHRERDYLMPASKIIKVLAEIQGHRRDLFQIKGNDTLKGNGKTILRERITPGLKSKSFAIQMVHGWIK